MITAEVIHSNTAGSLNLGTSDLPIGTIYAVTIYENGNRVAVLASPTFTGTPRAPTAVLGTNTTQLATTAFVQAALAAMDVETLDSGGDHEITAETIYDHVNDATIHLTAEQIRDLVAAFAAGGNTVTVTHNDGADTLTWAVKLKTNGGLTSDSDGVYVSTGTSANTIAAGDDSRFPTSAQKSSLRVHKLDGTADPTVNDDSADSYGVGSVWINVNVTPKRVFICVDATEGAASWERLNSSVSTAELDTALDSALVESATVSITHDTGADTFTFAVVPKSSSLSANEGQISATANGVVTVLGTSANTACAGNDDRLRQHNYVATTNPTTTDDSSSGYGVGSIWVNVSADTVFICRDATTDAAVWKQVVDVPSTEEEAPAAGDKLYGELADGSKVYYDIDNLPGTDGFTFYDTRTSLTGGTSADLDGITTTGITVPFEAAVANADSGGALDFYQLISGTDAEKAPWIIRPDDYASSTNEKVWRRLNPRTWYESTITSLVGGTSADLDYIPTTRIPVGSVVLFTESTTGQMVAYRLDSGTTAEASPKIVRPDDYAGGTNEKIWTRVPLGAKTWLSATPVPESEAVTAGQYWCMRIPQTFIPTNVMVSFTVGPTSSAGTVMPEYNIGGGWVDLLGVGLDLDGGTYQWGASGVTSPTSLAAGAEIRIDVTSAGSGDPPTGLQMWLGGYEAGTT